MTVLSEGAAAMQIIGTIVQWVVTLQGDLSRREQKAFHKIAEDAILHAWGKKLKPFEFDARKTLRRMADEIVSELQSPTLHEVSPEDLVDSLPDGLGESALRPTTEALLPYARTLSLAAQFVAEFRSHQDGDDQDGDDQRRPGSSLSTEQQPSFTKSTAKDFQQLNVDDLAEGLRRGLSSWDELYQIVIFWLSIKPSPGSERPDWGQFIWGGFIASRDTERTTRNQSPRYRWEWAGVVASTITREMRLSPELAGLVARLDQYTQLNRAQFGVLALSDLTYSARRIQRLLRAIGTAILVIVAILMIVFVIDVADVVEVTDAVGTLFREFTD